MIRNVVRSELFLRRPSEPADESDLELGQDLLDTLRHHSDECCGMAANMVGARRRVIVFDDEGRERLMFNPSITRSEGPYEATEGCLSLTGLRKAARYERIRVRYQDEKFAWREEDFSGWTAQIIQHEIDHCDGVVI